MWEVAEAGLIRRMYLKPCELLLDCDLAFPFEDIGKRVTLK
jgi:hypothetical protein